MPARYRVWLAVDAWASAAMSREVVVTDSSVSDDSWRRFLERNPGVRRVQLRETS